MVFCNYYCQLIVAKFFVRVVKIKKLIFLADVLGCYALIYFVSDECFSGFLSVACIREVFL